MAKKSNDRGGMVTLTIAVVAIVAMLTLSIVVTTQQPMSGAADQGNLVGDAYNQNDLQVRGAAGYGNAYACFDQNGILFRSETPCK